MTVSSGIPERNSAPVVPLSPDADCVFRLSCAGGRGSDRPFSARGGGERPFSARGGRGGFVPRIDDQSAFPSLA